MIGENMPPIFCEPVLATTSTPSVNGQTSVIMMPRSVEIAPDLSPACTAAPSAIASSGFTPRRASLPKYSCSSDCTSGMRELPPTSTTSVMRVLSSLASRSAVSTGSSVERISGADQLLEPRARQLELERQRLGALHREERQHDVRRRHRRQLHLRLLGRLLEAHHRLRVLAQVDAVRRLELACASHSATRAIEVAAAEVVVARRRLDVEHALEHLEHADVEGAAAEIVDEHELLLVEVVEPVGERRRRRLVEDAIDLEARPARPRPWSPGAARR